MKAFVTEKTKEIEIEDEKVVIRIADQGLRLKLSSLMDDPKSTEEDKSVAFFKMLLDSWTFKDADGSAAPIDKRHILGLDPVVADVIAVEVLDANPFLQKLVAEAKAVEAKAELISTSGQS